MIAGHSPENNVTLLFSILCMGVRICKMRTEQRAADSNSGTWDRNRATLSSASL